MIHGALLPDSFLFLRRHFRHIQFIAERSGESDQPPGLQRRCPCRSVVGADRNVGALSGTGIKQGGAGLDEKAVDGIGVVAGPDLGSVEEDPGIEPPAASAAAFDEQIRKFLQQSAVQFVRPQHKPVGCLFLTVRRQQRIADLCRLTVEIPLHIGDGSRTQNSGDGLKQIIHHGGDAHIEDELVSAVGPFSAGGSEDPVRMGFVKFALLRDHFRFKPKSEDQPFPVDLLRQRLEGADFLLIDEPVPQRTAVIIPMPEPAVIQHKHFHAAVCCAVRDRQQFFPVEVHVSAFPVIHEDGAFPMCPPGADQMIPEHIVKIPAHTAETIG